MLPLLQLHPQMVQGPPFEPLLSLQSHIRPDRSPVNPQPRFSGYSHHPYRSAGHSQRAFPIRASQAGPSASQRPTAAFFHGAPPDSSEYSLRRKTPNGTIDNGYDGSMTHLASGPPPLKHMAVSGNVQIYPTAVVHRSANSSAGVRPRPRPQPAWPFPATPVATNNASPSIDCLNPTLASPGAWNAVQPWAGRDLRPGDYTPLLHALPQYNHEPIHPMQYQQNPTTAVFSPAGFQQPPIWRDGVISPDYTFPFVSDFVLRNAPVNSAFNPPQPLANAALAGMPSFGFAQTLGAQSLGYPWDAGASHLSQGHSISGGPHQTQQALPLTPASSSTPRSLPADGPSNVRFRERALLQAHKAYADLILHLSHSRTVTGKSGLGSLSSSRMVVFPRPPKQLSSASSHARPQPAMTHLNHMAHLRQKSLPKLHAPPASGPPGCDGRSMDAHLVGALNGANHLPAVPNTASSRMLSDMGMHCAPFPHASHRDCRGDMGSPLLNARSSLDLLSTLCELGGWKWTDGMLLGGCLHYGLEHYEEALDWFKRIIELDESHVEAISNLAATLYCLNRQEEAERYWRHAVEVCPGYLEAVEHLVGLLCSSHRSQESVDIISHVQQALRVRRSASAHDEASETASETDMSSTASAGDLNTDPLALDADTDSPEIPFSGIDSDREPGHGSSGYNIPGSENGRMLLLIHAKGNMLYALKDIDRASKAFEEAVMISAGRCFRGVQSLTRSIQGVLAPRDAQGVPGRDHEGLALSTPLLLPPDKARLTANLVFSSSSGQLPGLQHIPDGNHKKAAVSTTSNALLSLAKIFQDTMSAGGTPPGLTQQATGVGDILALYYLSLSLQESPSTANNVGILLASVQQPVPRRASVTEAALCENLPGILPGSGLALALAYYQYGLSLDPKHVHLHTNLGSLLKDIGQLDLAIRMYEKAVQCDGTFDIALTNLANAVKDRGRINDAILYYKRAVNANPDFVEAVCGLSTALNSVCDWRDRGGVVLYDGKYDRWHVDKAGMFTDVRSTRQGSGLMNRVTDIIGKQLKDASAWGCGLLQEDAIAQLVAELNGCRSASNSDPSTLASALRRWAGQPWEGSRVLRLIERCVRAAMRDRYIDRHVGKVPNRTSYLRPRLPCALPVPSAPTVLPFHTFTCPLMARDIRMISQRNALRISCSTLRSPWLPASIYEPPSPPNPELKVGYVSSDFNNHPLAHLMQSVFGFHDPSRVKAFCYATTASDKSVHRRQIEEEAPVFRDVSSWTPERLVNQIVEDGIHILVNLNGYTRGARNEVFAARPAPIQMSFMGFAGTLGAEWCDYMLADTTAIPPSTLRPHRSNAGLEDVFRDEDDSDVDGWIYSENIIFCRDTFFCCDHRQSADSSDERGMTWEEEQRRRWKMRKELFPNLQDDAIIMGNFNQLYKIDPTTFRSWLRILDAVPNAVLWLLRFPELGESNLKRTARLWAGERLASRIIFTDVAPKQQHISRARVCDIFLDTPECNAHTTAADILWSSAPLLTLPRYEYKMCSRMGASILRGALPRGTIGEQAAKELIANDEAEYEDLAIRLASSLTYTTTNGYGEGSGRLSELRYLLWSNRWSCPLFDTKRWVRDLEEAYEEAWRHWVAGRGGDIYL